MTAQQKIEVGGLGLLRKEFPAHHISKLPKETRAQIDARDWHIPHTALIAELAQLHTMPATKAVCDRIDAIEADLNGWRDDYVHDLAYAYQNNGDDDAWDNAERKTPSIESLIEAHFGGVA